jgi:hypothetical protein
MRPARYLAVALTISCLPWAWLASAPASDPTAAPPNGESKIALVFTGGHDTNGIDRGRPVVLIAAALGVPEKVFRNAFQHVKPAPAGEQPDPAQVRLNKEALLQRLAPYGVTNERLDEVSNYYRYRPESGALWRHADAAGFATVRGCKIVAVTITKPGAGYSSPPLVSIRTGLTVYPMAALAFGTDLATNGSISKIKFTPLGDSREISNRIAPSDRIQAVNVQTQTQGVQDTPTPSH